MKVIATYLQVLVICFSLGKVCGQISFNQSLDSTQMLLGSQQYLYLKTSDTLAANNAWIHLDTMRWFHMILPGVWEQHSGVYERKILFTVFDTGNFILPPLGMINDMQEGKPLGQNLFLNVYIQPDSLTSFRPIKNIEETEAASNIGLKLILGITFLILLLLVLWQFFRADRSPVVSFSLPELPSPVALALQALDDLSAHQYWQQGKIKEYYDGLSQILRKFMTDGLKIPALEHTTHDTEQMLVEKWGILDSHATAIELLKQSDLVKFANRIPALSHHEPWWIKLREYILSQESTSNELLKKYKSHYLQLLGQSMAGQFSRPLDTVPDALLNAYTLDPSMKTLDLYGNLFMHKRFDLPATWVKIHHAETGSLYRWQSNILSSGIHRGWQMLVLFLVIPIIAFFLPVLWLVSLWKKESLMARGIFAMDENNKLFLKKLPERWS